MKKNNILITVILIASISILLYLYNINYSNNIDEINDINSIKSINSTDNALKKKDISKKELYIECKKVINNEKSEYLSSSYSLLINNYNKWINIDYINDGNDLYNAYNDLITKDNWEKIKYLENFLSDLDKSTMGYSSIYDALNWTNLCEKYRTDRHRCIEQSNIIKNIIWLYKYEYDTFLTDDYKSVYFYSLKNNLNYKEEFNNIFLRECLTLID